jgi:hypothetical protein
MTNTLSSGPLKTLVSARIRLSEDERAALKASYRDLRNQQLPSNSPVNKGSGISVVTQFGGNTELDRKLGLDYVLISDVLSSRDSLSLLAVLQLQETLGVPIISEKDFLDACSSYWKYINESVRK